MSFFVDDLADVKTTKIGQDSRIWQYTVILPGAEIGQCCNICSHCFIENNVIIGDRVTVKAGVQMWDGVRLGNDVFVGPNVTFTNDKYPKSRNSEYACLETWVEDGAVIGGGAIILPGIRIGIGAIVGAGAVVTKNVLPGLTVVGNPARVMKKRLKK